MYFLPGIEIRACILFGAAALLRSRLVTELRFLLNLWGSRSLSLYLDYLRSRVHSPSWTPFACFGDRLPDRIRIRVLLCTSIAAAVLITKLGTSIAGIRFISRFSSITPGTTWYYLVLKYDAAVYSEYEVFWNELSIRYKQGGKTAPEERVYVVYIFFQSVL